MTPVHDSSTRAAGGRQQAYPGPGGWALLVDLHRRGKVEAGEGRRGEQLFEQLLPVRGRHPHRPRAANR
jgi:hypothetical protein